MFVLVVEFHIYDTCRKASHRAIVENAILSVELDAYFYQFDDFCDPADPRFFLLYEIYDSETAFKEHLKYPHYLQMNKVAAGWTTTRTIRTRLRVQPQNSKNNHA